MKKINFNGMKPEELKELITRGMDAETAKEYILYSMTTNHTGKMSGMLSISTSVLENPICRERAKDEKSICHYCYASKQLKHQASTAGKMKKNTVFYTSVELTPEMIPFINAAFFRFESFGDIANVRQFENYCMIARKNPHCKFTLWTKNYYLIVPGAVPRNMSIIVSSPHVNISLTPDDIIRKNPNAAGVIDGFFTVYSPEYAEEHNISINCGARRCSECLKCYNGNPGYVAELLK